MYGAMEFYYAARELKLTPILGCEAYLAPRGRFDRTVRDEAHLTLLAADLVGYRNLIALVSKGFLEGYYYKPRIDLDLLAKHHDGLIALSGCMSGLVAAPLLGGDYDTALRNAKTYVEIFGDRFYIEVMRHGMPEQDTINEGLVRIARELSVPIVATNDAHYLEQKDAAAHDVLLCIGTGKTVSDTNRMKFYSDQFYLKSPQEMAELWADLPEAVENTARIAERVDIRIPEKIFHLPQYPVPRVDATPERSDAEYLRELCELGLRERYGEERCRERCGPARAAGVRARRHHEDGLFVVFSDRLGLRKVRARSRHPGRSGARVGGRIGSRVLPEDHRPRSAPLQPALRAVSQPRPDIDAGHRYRLLRGAPRRSHRATLRKSTARTVSRRSSRSGRWPRARRSAMQAERSAFPYPTSIALQNSYPPAPAGLSIADAVERIAELKSIYATQPEIRKLLDTAKEIEGLARNASTHAAGVVISAGTADRLHAARAFRRWRREHAVRHGLDRANRSAQDGLPRIAQPHGNGERGCRDPADGRSGIRPHGHSVRGCVRPTRCWLAERRWASFNSSRKA